MAIMSNKALKIILIKLEDNYQYSKKNIWFIFTASFFLEGGFIQLVTVLFICGVQKTV